MNNFLERLSTLLLFITPIANIFVIYHMSEDVNFKSKKALIYVIAIALATLYSYIALEHMVR